MRRRRPSLPSTASAAPVELRQFTARDWPEPDPLPCQRGGRCMLTHGEHDEWCAVFAARRQWHEARRDYLASGGVLA